MSGKVATLVLSSEDYEYMLAVLLARATEDQYHTNYDIIALLDKIRASKQWNDRKDRAHAI